MKISFLLIIILPLYLQLAFVCFHMIMDAMIGIDKRLPNYNEKEPRKAFVVWSSIALTIIWPISTVLLLIGAALMMTIESLMQVFNKDFVKNVYENKRRMH